MALRMRSQAAIGSYPLVAVDDPQRWWILAACCTVAFAQLAEPRLWMIGLEIPASAFGTAWRGYRIVSNIGVVLFVAFQLIGGVLGDLFGRRRLLLVGAVGATLANLLSLAAWSLPALVVARGLVGLLGALAFPLTLGVIRLSFVGAERKVALLIFAFVTALGTLASLLGIPIENWFGWRWALVLPIVAGAVGVWMSWWHVPESRAPGGVGRAEAIAAAAWAVVFLAFILGLAVARTSGTWRNPITIAAGTVGLLGLTAMILWSARPSSPTLLQRERHVPRLFLSLLLLVSATLSFALSGYVLQLYQFFFTVQQRPGLLSGFALAPIALGNLLTLRWASRFAVEQPRHVVIGSGLGMMGVAMLLSSLARPSLPYLLLVPVMTLFGLGFMVASATWTNFFFSSLPPDLTGVSAGIHRAAGLVGGALAGVILSAVVELTGKATFAQGMADLGLTPEQQALALKAVELALRNNLTMDDLIQAEAPLTALGLLSAYREAYGVAISTALLTGAAVCLGCGALAWLWLRSAAHAADVREQSELPALE